MSIDDLLSKSRDGGTFTHAELVRMLSCPPESSQSMEIMSEARRISEETTDGKAEVHGQFALDLAPCSCNCEWCSFAARNEIFEEGWQISPEEAVDYALHFEDEGANAILTMTTTDYPLSKMLDIAREIRRNISPDIPLIANTGDKSEKQAQKMEDAGYDGVYHALRLDEGKRNVLKPEKRLETIRNLQNAGLTICTCVEPVGPEHTNDELARMIALTATITPAFSGAARRIPIPNTSLAGKGMISELRMAQIVAVTRLAMPRSTRGNCTHEPCTLGAIGGASIFWAELGANPRDNQENTEENRGDDVGECQDIYWESGWEVLEGPSKHFTEAPTPTPPDTSYLASF
ncbi:MAG: radical SAM protein [Planctomycetota bacterium]